MGATWPDDDTMQMRCMADSDQIRGGVIHHPIMNDTGNSRAIRNPSYMNTGTTVSVHRPQSLKWPGVESTLHTVFADNANALYMRDR